MGSDRTRVSYNPGQQYRSVVMQQGRVNVDADWNEAQLIASEAARLEALDFVGPAGTPDNGYVISLIPGSFDFDIGLGTMYVGGNRASLPEDLQYSQQQQNDWMDSSNDASWVPVPTAAPTSNEYVYLVLREQEVSAVEDSDLKDIALGGPDTAQRTRLVQHIVRLSTTGTDCASALAAAQTTWAGEGFTLNGDASIGSFAQLQVGFVPPLTAATSCDPTAQGGYLGADNQLIRVQVSDAEAGSQCLLWGYDDASFLYGVTVSSVTPSATTVTLLSAPIDAEHIPQSGQVVEILMPAAALSNGQYVAAPTGQIFTLGASTYDPDSKTLTLPPGLNVSLYGDGTSAHLSPPQLFLRVWEGKLSIVPGTPQTLGATGVQVNLTSTNKNNVFRGGDYWMFAVRPATPGAVYPDRYVTGAQPPEGPRGWACPLAVIGWNGSVGSILSDCRSQFGHLASRALHVTGVNWPNDDLVSLPAFRNNPLQVTFDFSPTAQSISDSTMIVTVEIPYPQRDFYNSGFDRVAQAKESIAPKTLPAKTAPAAKLSSRAAKGTLQKAATVGQISGIGILNNKFSNFPINFPPVNVPNSLLSNYKSLIDAAQLASLPSTPQDMVGYMASIQPGGPTITSGTASWKLQMQASEFIPYLSELSQSAIGPQLRVRVNLKGREIWYGLASTTSPPSPLPPLVYMDGQVFGQPGLRADGVTPCTELTLPSGSDARASDFESWFWLSMFVWGQTDYFIGDLPLCMTTADFNGDKVPDIAVATLSGNVYILLNNGTGSFTVGPPIHVSDWPLSIVTEDFNGDGFNDLAVTSYTDGWVTILLGDGKGGFSAQSPIPVGKGPWALATEKFTGSGHFDLAVTNAIDSTVSILINGGTGTFSPLPGSTPISVGTTPIGLVAAELFGTGNIDLAVLNAGSNTVSLFQGNGAGAFGAANVPTLALPGGALPAGGTPVALPLSITTADFDNDGNPDLAVGGIYPQENGSPSYVGIFLNNSSGSGVGTWNANFPDSQIPVFGLPGSLVAVNLDPTNPTGSVDLVATGASFLGATSTSTFTVLLGDGKGSFQNPMVYPIDANPIAVVQADFNGDGIPDLAMTTTATNVSVLLNEQSQTTSTVVITGVVPAGAVHPGDQIQLTGKNFGVPDLNSIAIDGAPVTVINASLSSNTALVITVPSIQGISPQGQTAMLYLSNPIGSATWSLLLMPSQATTPTGQLAVAESQVSPTTAVAPGNIFVTFTISGNTTLADLYTVAPTVDAGWTAALVVGQNDPALIVPPQIAIPAANSPQMVNTSFVIMVTVPAGLPVGTTGNLNVTITSQTNPKNLNASTSQPYVLAVGSLPGGSQDAVIVSLSTIQAPGSSPDGKTLVIPFNASPSVIAIFNFQVNQPTTDDYSVTTPITFANSNGWSATILSGGSFSGPPNPPSMFIQLTAAEASGSTPAASTTTMTIRVVGSKTGAIGQAIFTVQPQ
jgi:hypothetical protein